MSKYEQLLQSALREVGNEKIKEAELMIESDQIAYPSSYFDETMSPILRRVRVRNTIRTTLRRTAAVFATLLIISSLYVAINEDARAYIMQFFRTHVKGGFTQYYVAENMNKPEDEQKLGVEKVTFNYVPKGFKLEYKDFEPDFGGVTYLKGKGKNSLMLDFGYYKKPKKGSNIMDDEHSVMTHEKLENGKQCDVYRCNTKGYASMIVWFEGDIMFDLSITDNLEGWEFDELLKIFYGLDIKYKKKSDTSAHK